MLLDSILKTASYVNNLVVLRKQLTLPSDAPAAPSTLDGLTYSIANDIEYLLLVINTALTEVETSLYRKIDLTVATYLYANTYYSGE